MIFPRDENTTFPREWSLNLGGKLFTTDRPIVMGIVNCTPDSFFSESRKTAYDEQRIQIEKHIREGASCIDLGAYSSRPGAADISVQEEIDRLGNAVTFLRENYPEIPISVDTFRSKVAASVLESGPAIINDISSGTLDSEMFTTVASFQAPVILMHMRGNPQNMQTQTHYESLIQEVHYFLAERIHQALQSGIKDIILDPGFGFAKDTLQNYELMRQMALLPSLGKPILTGISRKSMIYKLLETDANQALNATTALNMFALMQGTSILRVHDVREAMETIRIYLTLLGD